MMTGLLLAAGVALGAGALMSAAAVAAVRRVDLYRWAAQEPSGSRAALTLLGTPDWIGRTAAAVGSIGLLLAGGALAALVAPLVMALQGAVVVLLATPLLLAGAYAIPRAIGLRWPESVVRYTVPWLRRAAPLAAPVRSRPAAGRLGAPPGARLVSDRRQETPDQDELSVLAGVLAFTERPVREVMTPRTDIVAVEEGAALSTVSQAFADSRYSRLPVYQESLDHIVGMIYAFDLLKIGPGADLPLRPVTTAPASKRCADLLFEMQRDRRQFAVVLDEYGGTAGIVTFEDLLEELVGEIFDEYDFPGTTENRAHEIVEVTGATPAAEVAARFAVTLPAYAETIGGLLTRAAGRIPQSGERYLLGGLEFDVLHATPNRLERVVVRRGPVPAVSLEPDEEQG